MRRQPAAPWPRRVRSELPGETPATASRRCPGYSTTSGTISGAASAISLASFIAPALGGLSWQYLGRWHWLVCGVLGLAAGAGHLAASPARERRVTLRTVPA